ncbi:MAG: 16S rRNA (cytosine(1402)-N(4))-methyltransferase RsmH [Planctomycetota bacterium]|jgi:16S rRNA (cytosine1402-N4)-methyltransferase
MTDHGHLPVLLDEVVSVLEVRSDDVVVDCTVGRGGHTERLAQEMRDAGGKASGRLIGLDLDADNLEHVTQRLGPTGIPFTPVHDSFARVADHVAQLGVQADVVLADLGCSSTQLDDPARGFSFGAEGPLDMRLDRRRPVTAADLIATLGERELADLIFRYGEDPFARKIARKLVQVRELQPIQTTTQLAALVVDAYGSRARSSRMHPATRTFMALRITVNDELTALAALLEQIEEGARTTPDGWLRPGARIAIISFHSLEDRMVKRSFAELIRNGLASTPTRKPRQASDTEVQANPRARSARLRALHLSR